MENEIKSVDAGEPGDLNVKRVVDKDKILRDDKKGTGKGKKEGGKREDKRRVERPTIAEGLMRERANSLPLIEIFKREKKRRERQEDEKEIEEMEAFRKSTKVGRSPKDKKRRCGSG